MDGWVGAEIGGWMVLREVGESDGSTYRDGWVDRDGWMDVDVEQVESWAMRGNLRWVNRLVDKKKRWV